MLVRPGREFDPRIAALIRCKVRRLVGRHGFTPGDVEDLQQELYGHVLQSIPRHDPARASVATFVDRVTTHKIADVVRHARAQKRDRRLERPAGEGAGVAAPAGYADAAELWAAVASLPEGDRDVAVRLAGATAADVGRQRGLSRERVRGRDGGSPVISGGRALVEAGSRPTRNKNPSGPTTFPGGPVSNR